MDLVKDSFICSLIARCWMVILGVWRESFCASILARLGAAVSKLWKSSYAGFIISRDSRIDRLWKESGTYRLLSSVLDFIPRLLHRIYSRSREIWEGSLVFRAADYCGERNFILISWVLLMLLVTPQDYWNNVYSLAAVMLLLVLFLVASMGSRAYRLSLEDIGFFPVAFAGMVFVAFLTSSYRSASFRFLIFHITCMLAVLVCVNSIKKLSQLRRILGFAVFGVLASSICGLVQRAMGVEVDKLLVDITVNEGIPGRVFSFFENPNSFAMVLVMLLPICIAMALTSKGKMLFFYAGALVLGVIALVMTYSRGAWASFAFSIFVMFLVLWPRYVPLFIACCILALPVLPQSVYNRLLSAFNFSDSSIATRKYIYEASWALFTQNPLWGVGLGNDVVKIRIAEAEVYKAQAVFVHAHSIYLQIAAEMGIFGITAFVGSMISGIKSGVKAVTEKRVDRELQLIIGALVAGLAGVLLNGLVDYPWSYPRVMVIFWIVFALLLSGVKLANSNNEFN
ncbi:MAG: O-antigen ligase family protein [Oscillospiraceae bacterium]|jgi:putative inorganic carbon (HCO3(-)) transporter